jgi:hypothetical protein
MGEISVDMIWKRLDELQAGQAAVYAELYELRTETGQKLGAVAQTLVAVQRDIRNLQRGVGTLDDRLATLGIATDAHTDRLYDIEKHLGIGGPSAPPN